MFGTYIELHKLRVGESTSEIRLSPNIFYISEDFRETLSKMHKQGRCPCKRRRFLGIDPDALVDAMPWMEDNEISVCLWAWGGVMWGGINVLSMERALSELSFFSKDAVFKGLLYRLVLQKKYLHTGLILTLRDVERVLYLLLVNNIFSLFPIRWNPKIYLFPIIL